MHITLAVSLTAFSCIPALMLDRRSLCASESSGGADSLFFADAEVIRGVSFADSEGCGGGAGTPLRTFAVSFSDLIFGYTTY